MCCAPSCAPAVSAGQSILFGLCHFHSVIIERIKFGSKGWNKAYPFNTGDLMCSATVLGNYLEAGQSADRVPWSDLRYIFGDILYGGHITDSFDRLLCSEYLEFYVRDTPRGARKGMRAKRRTCVSAFVCVVPWDSFFFGISVLLLSSSSW